MLAKIATSKTGMITSSCSINLQHRTGAAARMPRPKVIPLFFTPSTKMP
jgi:hypothetical protein